jgi:hypothetical protein
MRWKFARLQIIVESHVYLKYQFSVALRFLPKVQQFTKLKLNKTADGLLEGLRREGAFDLNTIRAKAIQGDLKLNVVPRLALANRGPGGGPVGVPLRADCGASGSA